MSNNGHSLSAAEVYKTEFCSSVDDAWYSVRLVSDGDKLTVKYFNFPDDHDDVFEVKNFKNLQELKGFEKRCRPLSVQLQDSECSKAVIGTHVCASHSVDNSDLRFYDALIDDVQYNEHSFANGEEECRCKFLLCWQHGLNAGKLIEKNIENICIVQTNAMIDPALSSFLKLAREYIQGAPSRFGLVTNGDHFTCSGGKYRKEASSPSMKHKLTFGERLKQETKCARRSVGKNCPSEGRISNLSETTRQDTDVGGVDERYIMLVENLEIELSSSTILEFIRKQTGIAPEAYVFPSLSWESYTRGAILLDCEKDLEKLYGFLKNPNHIIVSSRGKPWVVMGKLLGHETFRASIRTFMLKSQIRVVGNADKLKVVHSGTEEYRIAKQLRDLFMEFADHQQLLHKRLATEERKILQLSQTV